MSKYMELKAQIEKMTAELEEVRRTEVEAEVADIKKRIIAFGITAEMLGFPVPAKRPPRGTGRRPGRPTNAEKQAAAAVSQANGAAPAQG